MSYQLPGEKKIIEKWDKIPGDITFVLREGDEVGDDGGCAIGGCWVKKTSAELFANKKVVIFGLPGAFTPTCSSTHLPGYEMAYDDLKELGIDDVYCISINDTFVMYGQNICKPISPMCDVCKIKKSCKYYKTKNVS